MKHTYISLRGSLDFSCVHKNHAGSLIQMPKLNHLEKFD